MKQYISSLSTAIVSQLKKKSVKDYFSVLSAKAGTQFVSIIKGLVVARYLGPEHFGILRGAELITMLEKFGNLGFKAVVTREIPYSRGANDRERETEVRDCAYSSEIVLSAILLLVGLFSTFFFESKLIMIVVALASVRLFFAKVSGILNTEAVIEKKFVLFGKIMFWTGLLGAVLVIITVPFWGIYTVMVIPILVSIISAFWYLKRLDFSFSFRIKSKELLRQLRIGIPLTLGVLSTGSYRYSERIMIISFLGTRALGLYGIAYLFMNQAVGILLVAIKVRKIDIMERLGEGKYLDVHRQVIRETLMLVLGGVILIPVLWGIIDIVVPRFLFQYKDAITICKVLIFAIPLKMLSPYMLVILTSPAVNKQSLIAPIQFTATILFVISVLIIKSYDMASILNIVIADIVGYAIFHVSIVFVYKRCFMDTHLRTDPSIS